MIGFIVLVVVFFSCQKDKDYQVQENTIKIAITDDTFQYEDDTILKDLYDEIKVLSSECECSNSSEWNFTVIGAKACGGPVEYIAYSSKLNTTEFLDKVDYYTTQQKKYNEKWGVLSTCDLPVAPSTIECKDGIPVFVYE